MWSESRELAQVVLGEGPLLDLSSKGLSWGSHSKTEGDPVSLPTRAPTLSRGPTLRASPKPNYLLKIPPPNALPWGIGASTYGFGGDTHIPSVAPAPLILRPRVLSHLGRTLLSLWPPGDMKGIKDTPQLCSHSHPGGHHCSPRTPNRAPGSKGQTEPRSPRGPTQPGPSPRSFREETNVLCPNLFCTLPSVFGKNSPMRFSQHFPLPKSSAWALPITQANRHKRAGGRSSLAPRSISMGLRIKPNVT